MVPRVFLQPSHTLAEIVEQAHASASYDRIDTDRHDVVDRLLAWRDMELCAVGTLAWNWIIHP